MSKRILFFLLSIGLVLTACQGNAPTTPATPAATQAPPTSTLPPEPAATSTKTPGCTVISPQPTPGPTETSLFPPHKDTDWVKGPDTASVTIIEYSDFQ